MGEQTVGREDPASDGDPAATGDATSPEVDGLLLIEEVSIDGMCGVY